MTLKEYLDKKDINTFISVYGGIELAPNGRSLAEDGITYISASMLKTSDFALKNDVTLSVAKNIILAVNERISDGFIIDGTILIHLTKHNNIYTLNAIMEDISNLLKTGQRWVPVYEERLTQKFLATDIQDLLIDNYKYKNKLHVLGKTNAKGLDIFGYLHY